MSTTVTVGTKRRATRSESVAAVKRSRRALLAKRRKAGTGALHNLPHHFMRTVATSNNNRYQLNSDSGIGFVYNGTNTGFFNMQFAFTLSGVQVYFGGVLSHTLAMPGVAEFTSLYDEYRIDWIEAEFYFSNNNSSVNSPATTLPLMYLVKDYDDANSAFVTDLQQYSTLQTWQLGNQRGEGKYVVRVKPNVDVAVFNTALSSGFARGKSMYIDTGSPNVPHYGLKIAYDPIQYTAATILGSLGVMFKYHMTMKHSK